jgi:hypothetical protein
MSAERTHLFLITGLALGLGYTMASSSATGYPAGAAVSAGSNPVVSAGGSVIHGSDEVVLTAPSDQALVLTDVLLASYTDIDCKRTHHTTIQSSSGEVLGEFETSSAFIYKYYDVESDGGLMVSHRFGSGLVVAPGETVSLSVSQTGQYSYVGCSSSDYGVRYSVSGYLAQP